MTAASLVLSLCGPAAAVDWSRDAVNDARFESDASRPGRESATILKIQVLLDRARVSPGVIDGVAGENTLRALRAYEEINGFEPDGKLDKHVWKKLTGDTGPALIAYNITKQDVEGPFMDERPDTLEEMSKLDALPYTSSVELLAEKFHMDVDLLKRLNAGVDFTQAGVRIIVANVRKAKTTAEVARVEVNKSREAVIAYDAAGQVIAYYPATIGSSSLPSPSGQTRVVHVVADPKYYYTPELDFEGAPQKKLTIPPGPNGPVGVMWIDLDKDGYGLHGTPNPATIGKESSHGCVRLTNWDVRDLGAMVRQDTPVNFIEGRSRLQTESENPNRKRAHASVLGGTTAFSDSHFPS